MLGLLLSGEADPPALGGVWSEVHCTLSCVGTVPTGEQAVVQGPQGEIPQGLGQRGVRGVSQEELS